MTVFATWWRRGRSGLRLGALLPFLALAGCGAPPAAEVPAPPPPQAPAGTGNEAAAAPAVPAGLTPLPSSQQVVAAFQVGRKDPFGTLPELTAPVAGGAKGRARAAEPPPAFLEEFRFSGVIQSAGQSEAVVTYRNFSGSLRPGDRGGRNTDLLPSGWSVASVDVGRGRLTLQSGSRKVSVDL